MLVFLALFAIPSGSALAIASGLDPFSDPAFMPLEPVEPPAEPSAGCVERQLTVMPNAAPKTRRSEARSMNVKGSVRTWDLRFPVVAITGDPFPMEARSL